MLVSSGMSKLVFMILVLYSTFVWMRSVFLLTGVVKMASHAIFQYNVLVIDIDNTTLGLI